MLLPIIIIPQLTTQKSQKMESRFHSLLLLLLLLLSLLNSPILNRADDYGGVGVIKVNYKFSGSDPTLSALRAHDDVRHLAIFTGVDLPLGGTGRPEAVGLYYAKIAIGTPSKDYYVQVDTGSDITWVNCIQCSQCPRRGYRGIELTLYNPRESLTGKLVSCDQQFCKEIGGGLTGCRANTSCLYTEVYGDGSYTMGYFVEDIVQYDRVSGDLQTTSANGSVIFGLRQAVQVSTNENASEILTLRTCSISSIRNLIKMISLVKDGIFTLPVATQRCGARQSGDLGSSDDALDGILGFGKSNSSMLSQLASSGRVKKMFAHCLDGVNGGGIFAIGHVVQPQVNMTPLVQDQLHYTVNMTAIQVGHAFLNLTTDIYNIINKKGVIIDSGTTLAYLPEAIYNPLVKQIFSGQRNMKLKILEDKYTCFDYSRSVDDVFPSVILHFGNSLSLEVHPHDYLFLFEDKMCIGWQNSGMEPQEKMNMTVLGGSSSIKLKDEITGSVHLVGAHSLSDGGRFIVQPIFLLLIALLHGLVMPPIL
ncbi:eukaryotic aspartyl protease family protein [Striga asiatica]|uniref:Eukaryotic aspartyl protease family protein n=1 Tax=Striga asiatica TaxID=4170 RepID=A0A5A7PK59_STRAF|nr:eukaryotic aspartyl protease family protein [Striga asiatica]